MKFGTGSHIQMIHKIDPKAKELNAAYKRLEEMIEENERLIAVLKFYADRKNWFEEMGGSSQIDMDQGQQARQAIISSKLS